MAWNPDQYLRFAQPRFRPAQDLLARIECEAPRSVYDLGCGAGNVTQLLAARWPQARIVGVDSSAEMIAEASKTPGDIVWQQRSIADWTPQGPADVIFTNAALHWLPKHEKLFPHLMAQLAPGGVLAAQMPRNFGAPSHMLIWQTVDSRDWGVRFEHVARQSPTGEARFYYDLLASQANAIDIWESEYLQILQGKDPVKEWTKGTWLKQFLDRLDPARQAEFEADYARRVAAAYPPQADGKTLFPFRRLFVVARKA